jgi:branched-chain amino acid transport system substrate-binding protein
VACRATSISVRRRSSIAATLVALVAAVATACTRGSADPSPDPEPVPVKIAFLSDMSVPGSPQIVAPSLFGLELAIKEAVDRGQLLVIPEVVGLDTEGDPAKAIELADQVAADPAYVAAVIAPFWSEPPAVGDALAAAGVPTLSLSGLDPSLASRGWSSWRRVVAGLPGEAAELALAIGGSPRSSTGVCLVGDGSTGAATLTDLLTKALGDGLIAASLQLADETALGSVLDRIDRTGCGAVGWTGSGLGATLLRTGMTQAGLASVPVLGSGAMKTDAYLATTAGAGDGTVVTCACVDLGSSTRPEARRFIHDFQSQYGAAPGVYGAEAWDVGGMLLRALRGGAKTRATVSAALAAADTYSGLANTYRFTGDGELASGSSRIHLFRAEGVRWVPLGETDSGVTMPVGTPGYLSMSACRTGPPFVYSVAGRLRGFDVELATAIARRLRLTLSWRALPCLAALRAVARGTLDAVLAPADLVPQGTPTTGVALGVHVALVAKESAANGTQTLLERLGPGDVVGVVRTKESVTWAKDVIGATRAALQVTPDRNAAYGALVAGDLAAVVDLEPDAWVEIERRPSLRVVRSIDVGAHDVFVARGPDAILVAAIDAALGRMIRIGRYALLFAKYFPGTPIPRETGT